DVAALRRDVEEMELAARALLLERVQEMSEVEVPAYVHEVPIIEPGALDGMVVDAKTERADEMKRALRCSGEPRNVARVGRNLRFHQNDMERNIERNRAKTLLLLHGWARK